MGARVREERLIFQGHSIHYRVGGAGAPLVLLKPHRLRATGMYELGSLLCQHYTVIELEPLGHAYSDRPDGYPFPIHDQVHAVADREGVGEFVVWGYSLGGPMALATAKESARVTAVVAGGYSPLDAPSEAALRRSNHSASREFMGWYRSFDWLFELRALSCPCLVYVGSEDRPRVRGPRGVPRTRDLLESVGLSVMVFDGLDHRSCGEGHELEATVVPAVLEWLASAATLNRSE